MLKKKIIASCVIAGTLVGGVAVGTAAYASSPSAPVSATAQTGSHPLRAWVLAHRRELRRDGVAISAKAIGISPQALVTELRSGTSIAEVAGQHGVNAQTVVNALDKAADAKINQAVTKHKLTEAQAKTIEAKLPARLTKAVDRVR